MNTKKENQLRPQSSRQWTYSLFQNWQDRHVLIRDQVQSIRCNDTKVDERNFRQGRRLAELLILRLKTVDTVLQSLIARPRDQVEKNLWTLLQLGTCELLFSSHDEPYAIVSETVELTRWLKQPRWTGFANGVLRNVQRLISDEIATTPASNHLPLNNGKYAVLNQTIFPDPEQQLEEYLGSAFSFPQALVKSWSQQYGNDMLLELGFASLAEPPLTVRLAPAINRKDWIESCREREINVEAGSVKQAVKVLEPIELATLPDWSEGQIAIQDETAMQAVLMMKLNEGETILDLCAGRGTKSIQMAEEINGTGTVWVTDISDDRLAEAEQSIERSRGGNLRTINYQEIVKDSQSLRFDAILVDAPCSNTGVLAKRPEARWRYSQTTMHELNDIQMQLLDLAAERLVSGGRIIYATCSIERKENEQLAQRWLERHPEFRQRGHYLDTPNGQHDGGYCVTLQRSS